MKLTPFLTDLLSFSPKLTGIIAHPVFDECLRELHEFARFDQGGSLILVTGPSQAGKSMLLRSFVEFLHGEIFVEEVERELPVIGAAAQTAWEGRSVPKYVYEMLLGDAGSPLHDVQKMIASLGYTPSKSTTEERLLLALTRAMRALNVRYVLVDEAQFLARSKDERFKSSLVESLKSLITYDRTVVLVGGYEIAGVVLEQREHLATRPYVIHMRRYRNETDDFKAWLQVMKKFHESSYLHFEDDRVLLDAAPKLIEECHGQVGQLQTRLLEAKFKAGAKGMPITREILSECRQRDEQWKAIRNSILAGDRILDNRVNIDTSDDAYKQETIQINQKRRNRPFIAKPRRSYKVGSYE